MYLLHHMTGTVLLCHATHMTTCPPPPPQNWFKTNTKTGEIFFTMQLSLLIMEKLHHPAITIKYKYPNSPFLFVCLSWCLKNSTYEELPTWLQIQ